MKMYKFNEYIKEAYVSKEKMKEVQTELKETFPQYKFSIKKRHYSTICVTILSGPLTLTKDPKGHEQVNGYYIQEHFKDNPEAAEFLQQVMDIINKGNYNNSDYMTDYFNVGFYIDFEIGQWDKPYVVDITRNAKKVSKPKKDISILGGLFDKDIDNLKNITIKPKLDIGKSYIDSNGNLMSFESFMNRYNELKDKFHLNKFEQFIVESVAKNLKDYIKDEYKNDFKDDYGFYEIKSNDPEKVKKQLLKDFESGIMKIDVDGKKLTIFKNDAKFDCVMLYADIDKKKWEEIQQVIEKDDLYEDPEGIEEYGLESESHLTLIYGINSTENNSEKIIKMVSEFKPIKLKLGKVSMFETDKYDVIKIDVSPSKELLKYRKELIENTKNTQSYNIYVPHMTLGYVKKGKGEKYINKIKINELGKELNFDTIKYSDSNNKKKTIKLKD